MHRGSVTGQVEYGIDVEDVAGEMVTSSVTPSYGLSFLSSAGGTSQPPQYITPESLNYTDLHPVAFDYFPRTTGIQPHGTGPTGYGLATPEPDWAEPSYFSVATSSARFSAHHPFSAYGSVSPGPLFDNPVSSCDPGLLSPAPSVQGTASSGNGLHSCSSTLMAAYAGHPSESLARYYDFVPGKSPETDSIRGATNTPGRWASASSSRMARPAVSTTEAAGETTLEGRAGNKIQLRTAYRKAKTKRRPSQCSTAWGRKSVAEEEDEQEDPLTPEERRARESHNIVEKQYRNRLNAQFVRLLAILPAEQQRNGSSGDDSAMSDNAALEDKRVSKAEVLDLATKRIKALEAEMSRLEEENSTLVSNVDAMTGAAAGRGLVKMG